MTKEQEHRNARKATAKHTLSLLHRDGVNGVFTGEKTTNGKKTGVTAIVVTVDRKKDVPENQRIPSTIDGIPTDIIEERIIPSTDTSFYDPLQGGTSTSINFDGTYGTIGLVVRDIASGYPLALSNYHVFYRHGAGAAGDTVLQPSYTDSGRYPDEYIGDVLRGSIGDSVDAAVCSVINRDVVGSVVDVGTVTAAGSAAVDMIVKKRGRTTGTKEGTVIATDYSTSVAYLEPLGTQLLTGLVRVEANDDVISRPGDSGSVYVSGSTVVALNLGSNEDGTIGVASPILDVFSALAIELYSPRVSLVLTGAEVKGHANLISVNPIEGDDNVPDTWGIWGVATLVSDDSTLSIGIGNPLVADEYPAFYVTFAGPTAPGSGVAFTLTDPTSSIGIGSDSFLRNLPISFAIYWDPVTKTLSCEAEQTDHAGGIGDLVFSGTPLLSLPYVAVIAGTVEVGTGDIATISKLQAGRNCGVSGTSPWEEDPCYTPAIEANFSIEDDCPWNFGNGGVHATLDGSSGCEESRIINFAAGADDSEEFRMRFLLQFNGTVSGNYVTIGENGELTIEMIDGQFIRLLAKDSSSVITDSADYTQAIGLTGSYEMILTVNAIGSAASLIIEGETHAVTLDPDYVGGLVRFIINTAGDGIDIAYKYIETGVGECGGTGPVLLTPEWTEYYGDWTFFNGDGGSVNFTGGPNEICDLIACANCDAAGTEPSGEIYGSGGSFPIAGPTRVRWSGHWKQTAGLTNPNSMFAFFALVDAADTPDGNWYASVELQALGTGAFSGGDQTILAAYGGSGFDDTMAWFGPEFDFLLDVKPDDDEITLYIDDVEVSTVVGLGTWPAGGVYPKVGFDGHACANNAEMTEITITIGDD